MPTSTSNTSVSPVKVAPLPAKPLVATTNTEVQASQPKPAIAVPSTSQSPAPLKPQPSIPRGANLNHQPSPHSVTTTISTPSSTSVPVPKPLATPSVKKTPAPIPVSSSSVSSQSTTKSKGKKKKNQPTVTMATAATATSGGPGTQGENTGRWTAEEHRLFLQGLEQHGKGWKKIASLIKSRTVVQIRTHAQKYFQKLAKARQNGEEGEISMEGRGGPASVTSTGIVGSAPPSNKRRRQTTGTKRKAITSVVVSATKEGKKLAAAQTAAGIPCPLPQLPAVAPALAPFVVPPPQQNPNLANANGTSVATPYGSISGPALEDSLFRFLTPAPVQSEPVQVNEVARQVGANPITLPSDNPSTVQQASGGEVSPTGVTDVAIFPSWTDAKDMPSWYAKGADVDCLLDVADTLDWLTDTGDLHETYEPPTPSAQPTAAPTAVSDHSVVESEYPSMIKAPSMTLVDSLSNDSEAVVPPLPSLFESSEPSLKKMKTSLTQLAEAEIDDHLDVFDTPMEEHAFVSALLENTGESSASLPVLS
mmetsp:Transcript_19304/g.28562  ORF Transcript_19304/g.28562 Transcript_19304/m.28562 type:complete len:535 (+) Transcript_19304:117-1721(+)|eukprot:CAMPEP_0194223128 /NCGR_PEP_ID=MMETSP0156-20130528/34394_1 /TAXON_ID=33649 /ORGANISM="Thalassionema nitzschioides, Strain L26-B" /LENGTH=534 /DNA_ID=CAMNT_0038954161 /DNA_START=135 /DNA_END=1742 /DNA_ORIENTATION=-